VLLCALLVPGGANGQPGEGNGEPGSLRRCTDCARRQAKPPEAFVWLLDSRFKVSIRWEDFRENTGNAYGARIPSGEAGEEIRVETSDAGVFWFSEPEEWELVVKVLKGCPLNDHFWVFSAATTNVEYTLRVTDTWTNYVKTYTNPLDMTAVPVTDTEAFETCGAEPSVTAPPCVEDGATLCLGEDDRFKVEVVWRDHDEMTGAGSVADVSSSAQATTPVQSDQSGLFWFFSNNNWETMVKVVDACQSEEPAFWFFAAATTNVAYEITVVDTWAGQRRVYTNPLGQTSPAIIDPEAFLTCDTEAPED